MTTTKKYLNNITKNLYSDLYTKHLLILSFVKNKKILS